MPSQEPEGKLSVGKCAAFSSPSSQRRLMPPLPAGGAVSPRMGLTLFYVHSLTLDVLSLLWFPKAFSISPHFAVQHQGTKVTMYRTIGGGSFTLYKYSFSLHFNQVVHMKSCRLSVFGTSEEDTHGTVKPRLKTDVTELDQQTPVAET